ncbi:MAG: hypothetical protein KJZ96_13815 [Rhodocyclaceae bacterium]|nr:hypothetical protein [Rhodocyclaceae bacterium]MCL4759412.1 hypothetical protein [Rhodocyclaceae bacterium]
MTPSAPRCADVWLLCAGIATLALAGGLAWMLAPLGTDVVALQLAFSPRSFGHIVHSWTADELARYRSHLPFDFLLLIAYGAFGYRLAAVGQLFDDLGKGARRLAAAALPLAAACDAIENTLHLWLTAAPRFGMPTVYAVSAGSALLKWLLIISFAGAVAWLANRSQR